MQTIDKKKKQDLGIFYTDPRIVNFIYDILLIWKEKEERETGRWESQKHYPSVIDPAVGEGIFLKVGLERGFTTPKYVFGIDIDEAVKNKWEEINLLRSFGSKAELEVHFYHQNGLIPLDDQKRLRHKRGGLREFDAAVGNPPYGGIGVDFKGKLSRENMELLESLENYEILIRRKRGKSAQPEHNPQTNFFQFQELGENKVELLHSRTEVIKFAQSTPVEILFLERFIQLTKPGGWIAIIIPDGILANSNSHYVREFIAEKTKIEAIISLPREAFKNVGTNAKTSILFLQKLKDKGRKQDLNYQVFLASVESLDENNFKNINNLYKECYNKTMNNNNLVQTIKDEKGKELVMVRVDKTLKAMTEEKPFSRFDVNYWHPKWDRLIEELKVAPIKKDRLANIFPDDDWLIATDHVRASRGEKEGDSYPVEYYSPAGLLFCGYDTSRIPHCTENAYKRMKRARPARFDVLLGGFGMGPTGKSVVLWHEPAEKAIVGNIFILRTKDYYNPFVLDVFFKTKFGRAQFSKYKTGVAFNSLSNDEIQYLLVPIFSKEQIRHIEQEYKKITTYYDKGMEAKKAGDETDYKKNIDSTEKMLKDLIAKVEAIISGEREDVI